MADALERVTSLTSLNGCDQFPAIRAGGPKLRLDKLDKLGDTELWVWVARFLERSGDTLTELDVRCGWGGVCVRGRLWSVANLN